MSVSPTKAPAVIEPVEPVEPCRVRYFAHFRNNGMRRIKLGLSEDRGGYATNRADRRSAGQVAHRLFVNTSPRMRHGNDSTPRASVHARRVARAVRAAA